jgi:uridine nucleosidase
VSGESGLDGVTLLPQPIEPAVTDVDYLEAMYRALISTAPDTAWLVSTGTLTNIGLLFQKYPDLAGHLKGVSIMGGAVGGGFTDAPMGKVKGEGERFGNWTAYAEFNVSRDCTKAILRANTNIDLCKQVVGCANTTVANTSSVTLRRRTSSSRIPSSSRRRP